MGREKELIGRQLGDGRFEILALLGQGAFAEVYRGRQINLNRDVAIKILHERDAQDDHLVKRFHHEASAIAQFDHPHIVKIFDHGEDDGLNYYVMNLLPKTLRSLLASRQILSIEFIIRMAHQLAGALDYAQRTVKNFLHRDIKPENVMLDRDHNAILSDFGLVRGEQFSQMTMRGAMMGTPVYMAPELWQPETTALDGRVDLYALGILLYECAAGAPPFRGEFMQVRQHHLDTLPAPPRKYRTDLPPEVEKIILRLIKKRPEERYSSAAELLQALSPLVKTLPDRIFIHSVFETVTIVSPHPDAEQKTPPATVILSERKPVRKQRPVILRRPALWLAAILFVGVIAALWQFRQPAINTASLQNDIATEKKLPSPVSSLPPKENAVKMPNENVAAKPQQAPLRIFAIPACEILVDGKSFGFPSNGRLALETSPGRHELAFRHPIYGFVQRSVEVKERIGLNYTFKWLGKINVIASSEDGKPIPAAIFLDGKPTPEKTPGNLDVPIGEHEIRVNKFEYEMIGPAKTVKIAGGDQISVSFVLRRLN